MDEQSTRIDLREIVQLLDRLDEKYRQNAADNRTAGLTATADRWQVRRHTIEEIRNELRLPWKSIDN